MKLNIQFSFLLILVIMVLTELTGSAYAQDKKADSVAKAKKDSLATVSDKIITITNSISLKDTAKINEVIVFKLKAQNVEKYTTLYVNSIKVAGLKALPKNNLDSMVYFKLDNNVQKVVEQFLASKPVDKVVVPVWLSIGDGKTTPVKFLKLFQLEVRQTIERGWIWAMVVILIMLLILALKNNILKDDNNLYYSLGRTQLLYWTILLCFAYIYLCQSNGTLPAIPSSILIIVGISATTTAASKLIENDMNKANVQVDPNAKSQGLIIDILSDANSINIQRFQNVVFNLLFGIVFIQKTVSTDLMPEFDSNVLLMMGISAGTYAGLKSTEDKNKPIPPNNNPGGPGPNGGGGAA